MRLLDVTVKIKYLCRECDVMAVVVVAIPRV